MGRQIQVISADAQYQPSNVEAFLQQHNLSKSGVKYTTVAIMGPQSSGKSTLLNAVFGTDFKMMNAEMGRSQTTQGVWLDLSPKLPDMPTLVMDLEGSDGRERGEDDTTFERQSALFALAMSDILMINLFAVNIGRVQGSGAPLLKTVLQVNLKLFQAAPSTNKTILLIVIRDRTRTPHAKMCSDMRNDLDTIWNSLVKPPQFADSPLDDFFELQYVSLPSFELEEDDFRAECTILRRRFNPDNETTLLRPDSTKVPASALPLNLQQIWQVIVEQKDLDLPAHKVMVAHIRCKDIAAEQLAAVQGDPAWQSLTAEASAGTETVPDFGSRAAALIESCLYGYDTDAMYFVDSVRSEQKAGLAAALYAALQPAFGAQRSLLQAQAVDRLSAELEVASKSTSVRFVDVAASTSRDILSEYERQMREQLLPEDAPEASFGVGLEELSALLKSTEAQVRASVTAKAEARAMEDVEAAVDGPAWVLISQLPPDLWMQLRGIIKQALKQSITSVDRELAGFGVPEEQITEIQRRIATSMSSKLVKALRKFLQQLNKHLLTKFIANFEEDNGTRRAWNSDLQKDAETARAACARALQELICVPQGLQVAGLSDSTSKRAKECVTEFIKYSNQAPSAGQAGALSEREMPALLTMLKWAPEADPDAVLLTPADVREAWQEFMTSSQAVVRRAKELQEERRRSTQRPLPLWVLPALLFFGWNEIMSLLKSPIWLFVATMVGLFLFQLYKDLEVDKEMEKGLPASAISLVHKLMPTSKRIFINTFQASRTVFEGMISDDSKQKEKTSPVATDGQGSEIEMQNFSDSPVQGLHHRKAGTSSMASSSTNA